MNTFYGYDSVTPTRSSEREENVIVRPRRGRSGVLRFFGFGGKSPTPTLSDNSDDDDVQPDVNISVGTTQEREHNEEQEEESEEEEEPEEEEEENEEENEEEEEEEKTKSRQPVPSRGGLWSWFGLGGRTAVTPSNENREEEEEGEEEETHSNATSAAFGSSPAGFFSSARSPSALAAMTAASARGSMMPSPVASPGQTSSPELPPLHELEEKAPEPLFPRAPWMIAEARPTFGQLYGDIGSNALVDAAVLADLQRCSLARTGANVGEDEILRARAGACSIRYDLSQKLLLTLTLNRIRETTAFDERYPYHGADSPSTARPTLDPYFGETLALVLGARHGGLAFPRAYEGQWMDARAVVEWWRVELVNAVMPLALEADRQFIFFTPEAADATLANAPGDLGAFETYFLRLALRYVHQREIDADQPAGVLVADTPLAAPFGAHASKSIRYVPGDTEKQNNFVEHEIDSYGSIYAKLALTSLHIPDTAENKRKVLGAVALAAWRATMPVPGEAPNSASHIAGAYLFAVQLLRIRERWFDADSPQAVYLLLMLLSHVTAVLETAENERQGLPDVWTELDLDNATIKVDYYDQRLLGMDEQAAVDTIQAIFYLTSSRTRDSPPLGDPTKWLLLAQRLVSRLFGSGRATVNNSAQPHALAVAQRAGADLAIDIVRDADSNKPTNRQLYSGRYVVSPTVERWPTTGVVPTPQQNLADAVAILRGL